MLQNDITDAIAATAFLLHQRVVVEEDTSGGTYKCPATDPDGKCAKIWRLRGEGKEVEAGWVGAGSGVWSAGEAPRPLQRYLKCDQAVCVTRRDA